MSYLAVRAKATLELRRRREKAKGLSIHAPKQWDKWLVTFFPKHFNKPFAGRHVDLWEWVNSIQPGVRPRPFCGFWARGGAKSTNAELIPVKLGAFGIRRYCWYISGTQDKADSHVENISGLLESNKLSEYYPELTSRLLGKYGASKGWRHNRLRTESGLTVDSLGLDTGARGVKIEDARPDIIIFDDVDDLHDTIQTTNKKKEIITNTILPSGSSDCVVIFIQNLIHPESIAMQLADGRADFLTDRIISGPYPAVEGLTYVMKLDPELGKKRYYITGGKATWEGQSLAICESQINLWGLTPFLKESQHDVERSGGLWDHIEFEHVEYNDRPKFDRTSVWVDPAVTSTDQSDNMGITAGGIDTKGIVHNLYAWEGITSPEKAIARAIRKAIEIGSTTVGIETDQGGDTWKSVYARALKKVKDAILKGLLNKYQIYGKQKGIKDWEAQAKKKFDSITWPYFISDKAGAGYGSKAERNQKMLTDYEHGTVKHVTGTHKVIEKALKRFPNKPLDVADSWFWTWNDLRNGAGGFAEFARRRLKAMREEKELEEEENGE